MPNNTIIVITVISVASIISGLTASFVHMKSGIYHEFQTGTNKGFGCYCYNDSGQLRWEGKAGNTNNCSVGGKGPLAIPKTPYLIGHGVTNLDTTACCKKNPTVNGRDWPDAPKSSC